ncbi:acyl-[acyl-carrier-protein] thioesterase [Companilactobacillus bobalius]|uniref:Dodecanoyl-[acyl-carrier-protein] hydrolase n=2 Tax=Companilactobacillus bobalius TaxID=2801451 RepID=A0A202FEA2_9LACO|nr:acyl-ACP thioesterase domain-containing protein [Companilactobacillus bobalius]KAE9557154.1 acyl-ACP thioesterase [Companilactobacillus bobalius]OVE98819.1 Dodecanoyl-[acyl-carrier-protein] hydrolase [Companilactobacillus bobalius]GEO57993.1 acyl-ACP thioesterase [Companilactobacillus paralimentarius]
MTDRETYSMEVEVPYYFANFTGDIRLSALIDIMLLTSEKQLHQADADSTEMVMNNGLGWVVVQYHMDINQMPRLGQKLKVTTQATSYNKYFFYRDFWIEDMDGNVMVKAQSAFVLIDIKERKIVSAADRLENKFGAEEVNRIQRFARLRVPEDYDFKQPQHIGYYNIDVNKHVNNSYYFDWMVDTLDTDYIASHHLKSMDIKYEKELNLESEPLSFAKVDSENHTSTHWIKNGDTLNVIAQLGWEDK